MAVYFKNTTVNYLNIYLTAVGIPTTIENHTSKGRVDLSLELKDKRIIFEFKYADKDSDVKTKLNEAIEQIRRMCDYPMTEGAKIRIMPDVHAGKGCVIGFTGDLGEKVIPNIVGVDIGCGMLCINLGKVDIDFEKLDQFINNNIPSGMNVNEEKQYDFDLSTLKSTVAFPHLPENTHTIDEINAMDEIKIDQVVIGSCTNGRMDDLRIAASILKGKKVKKGIRVIIIPATQKIYLDAMEAGYIKTFIEAGAIVSTPTCGPCLGGYMGILAEGEKCVSTTNRNFVGRMGHVTSEIYLASPAVAAASAITGKISCPCELE